VPAPWEWARRYAAKEARLVIGLMSGTSVDGVDAALVRIAGSGRATRVTLLAFVTLPFAPEVRAQVLALSHGQGNAEDVSRCDFRLGQLFADAADAVLETAGITRADLDLIASHGQTISHTPPPAGATLQIGEAAVIAGQLGVPAVSDFRVSDMAAGGQGAPLVPYADWCLLTHPARARAIQNIGGIGNVTYLSANAAPDQVIGFDTGPGNMLIDQAVSWATDGGLQFDKDGDIAARGRVYQSLLSWLMQHPFLREPPPKSAGREQFGAAFWREASAEGQRQPCRPPDIVATVTAFTAQSIADAYRRFLPPLDEVVVGGGGARNPTLMRMLQERLAPAPVITHEAVGINGDAKEAIAFAVLANETLLGNPSSLPSVTGAARPVVLGKLTLP
jgi:anhydro-N-acetylmuramic acid kinase